MKKTFLNFLLISIKFSFLISTYGFVASVVVDTFMPPFGAFAFLYIGIFLLEYLSFMVIYSPIVTLIIAYIFISKKSNTPSQMRKIGLLAGIILNIILYSVFMVLSANASLQFTDLIDFLLTTFLLSILSMWLFSKLNLENTTETTP